MSVNVGYRGIAQVADWLGLCIWSHKNSDSRSATAAKKNQPKSVSSVIA